MKAPADASSGRGLWSLPSAEKLPMAGRRPANSCRGEMGEGAGRAASYMEAHKSARGVHKLFACMRCTNTSSSCRLFFFLLFTGLARTHPVRHLLIVDRACSRSARDRCLQSVRL